MEFPRYTTFTAEEKQKLFGILPGTTTGRSKLLKALSFSVCYPDGTEGACCYERLGATAHRFDYRYLDGEVLSRVYLTSQLVNNGEAIEARGRELADGAFSDAMEFEQKDYFARASEPSSGARKKDPGKYRMKAGEAKKMGGKYALCMQVGTLLVPVSQPVETFSRVAALWGSRRDASAVIACCNRLDRCWELLKYNPLTAEGHPRRQEP